MSGLYVKLGVFTPEILPSLGSIATQLIGDSPVPCTCSPYFELDMLKVGAFSGDFLITVISASTMSGCPPTFA